LLFAQVAIQQFPAPLQMLSIRLGLIFSRGEVRLPRQQAQVDRTLSEKPIALVMDFGVGNVSFLANQFAVRRSAEFETLQKSA
jgi:hypothetical protein